MTAAAFRQKLLRDLQSTPWAAPESLPLSTLSQRYVLQFGAERVARFLQLPGDVTATTSGRELLGRKHGMTVRAEVSAVFSRFLNYLRYVELQNSAQPVPEMAWFVSA